MEFPVLWINKIGMRHDHDHETCLRTGKKKKGINHLCSKIWRTQTFSFIPNVMKIRTLWTSKNSRKYSKIKHQFQLYSSSKFEHANPSYSIFENILAIQLMFFFMNRKQSILFCPLPPNQSPKFSILLLNQQSC